MREGRRSRCQGRCPWLTAGITRKEGGEGMRPPTPASVTWKPCAMAVGPRSPGGRSRGWARSTPRGRHLASAPPGTTYVGTERKGHGLQDTNKIPQIPWPKESPQRDCQALIEGDIFISVFVCVRLSPGWRFLSQPLGGDRGEADRTAPQVTKPQWGGGRLAGRN